MDFPARAFGSPLTRVFAGFFLVGVFDFRDFLVGIVCPRRIVSGQPYFPLLLLFARSSCAFSTGGGGEVLAAFFRRSNSSLETGMPGAGASWRLRSSASKFPGKANGSTF